ncbi:porin family protein [Gangjinia marincola]
MRSFFIIVFLGAGFAGLAQDIFTTPIDSSYREDQFYIGFTYNVLVDRPDNVNQTGFSGGLNLGFIRDVPFNNKRTLGIGVGLGLSVNTYVQNLFIGEEAQNETTIFRALDRDIITFDTNRFSTYLIEVPFHFRWRSSNIEKYKFWRIYTGLQLGYIYHFSSYFNQSNNTVRQTDVPELERFRLGTSFSFGFNAVNFQVYYALNDLFDAEIDGEQIGLQPIKVGLIFYLL